jgi:hypothetical protein
MTRESLRAGGVTTETISDALMLARGDLFVAASILGVTGRELDSYIRASDQLQGFAAAIGSVKASAEYKRLSDEQFADELERLTKGYRLEALDVIHEVATLPIITADRTLEDGRIIPGDRMSAAELEVKLKAAIALHGKPEAKAGVNDNMAVLAELNDLYAQNAPRIKTIRAVQIEYDHS